MSVIRSGIVINARMVEYLDMITFYTYIRHRHGGGVNMLSNR